MTEDVIDISTNPYSTPVAELVDYEKEVSLLIFKRFSAWFVLLLGFITFGIYGYFWAFIRSRTLNQHVKNKISEILIYTAISLYVADIGFGFTSVYFDLDIDERIIDAIDWMGYSGLVLHVVWIFYIRSRIIPLLSGDKTFGLHISGILTFFFGSIYLQYKINEGIDAINEVNAYQEIIRDEKISNEDLIIDGIDYSKYSKSELQDCLMNIDSETYAERAKVVKKAFERL